MYEKRAIVFTDTFSVCEREAALAAPYTYLTELLDHETVGTPLLAVASLISEQPLKEPLEALATICEEDALDTLMTMPNRFWFWRVLQHSLLHHGAKPLPIDIRSVTSAIEAIRSTGSSASVDDTRQLVETGVLLVEIDGATRLVANPVFHP